MNGLTLAYGTVIVLSAILLAMVWFVATFWRGGFGGSYGQEPYTTTLEGFSFDQNRLPEGWVVQHAADNYISFGQNRSDGCVVDINRISGLNTKPTDAQIEVEEDMNEALDSMDGQGYSLNRLGNGWVDIETSNGPAEWPTIEFEGRWLDDDSLYFRQSNSLMVGDGYYLQIGRACQDSGDLSSTEDVIDTVRFH